MKRSNNTFLQRFFWVAFAAFLGASIPHVAYFFRSYEPAVANLIVLDIGFWIVSLFLAGSIDVMIFLLSKTVANMIHQKKSTGLISSVWAFIIILTSLSWYMNYKYAIQFRNTVMISSTPVNLFGLAIPDINPILASSFMLLAIGYTWIADKIANDAPPLTVMGLTAQANELEEMIKQQARIKAAKQQGTTSLADKAIGVSNDAKHVWRTIFSPKAPVIPQQQQEQQQELPAKEKVEEEPESIDILPEGVIQEETITEAIPVTPVAMEIVEKPEPEPVKPSLPTTDPLQPKARITQPLPLIIEGVNNRNMRYEFAGVTYDSLKKAAEHWRANPYRCNFITEDILKQAIQRPELAPYMKLVQGTGKNPMRTIALTDDAVRAVYMVMGRAKVLPPSLKLTVAVLQTQEAGQ